jgi:hypothetical protein
MTFRALTLDDVAGELGRSAEWLSNNWRDLVKAGKLPKPLLEKGPPTWDAAQVYAVRDKNLTAAQRAVAAAFRAAIDAAHTAPADALYHDEEAADRRRLDLRFSPGERKQA